MVYNEKFDNWLHHYILHLVLYIISKEKKRPLKEIYKPIYLPKLKDLIAGTVSFSKKKSFINKLTRKQRDSLKKKILKKFAFTNSKTVHDVSLFPLKMYTSRDFIPNASAF